MIKLMPPYIKESVASNAERKIFNVLGNLNYDGTALHSLGLANHRNKVYGEIDFVLICREGILCLEIKGGLVHIDREGVWNFIDRFGNAGKSNEGPFNQVVGSMFSLRDYVKDKLGRNDPLYKCQYACGVVFPDTVFKQHGPDVIDDIVIDARYSDEEFSMFIENCFKYWRNKCLEKNGFQGDRLGVDSINRAEVLLRGSFGAIPSMNIMLGETDHQIVAATEDQYQCIEMLDDNDRVIIKGGAGTGKTLLAMEHARRQALVDRKVLYICYNKALAEHISGEFSINHPDLADRIEIVHFHGLLSKYIGESNKDEVNNTNDYYQNVMPERFIDYIADNGIDKEQLCDVLILDEGQDLLRVNYLMCLDELINGKLRNGSWFVFYDHNQNIYNKNFEEGLNEIMKFSPAILKLNTNCRNTKQIGIFNTLLSGIKHEKYLKVNGDNVTRESYTDYTDERRKLIAKIKNLKSQGVSLGDIVILSPYTYENSCLNGENIFKSICTFQNITGLPKSHIVKDALKFSTIHSFKGLESRVIIVIDLDRFCEDERKQLHYVAVSRARVLLHVFYKESHKSEMEEQMKNGFLIMAE